MGQDTSAPSKNRAINYAAPSKPGDKDPELNKLLNQLEKTSEKGALHNQIGLIYYNNEDYDKAEIHLTEAYASGATTHLASYYLGTIKEKKKFYVDAITLFKDAVNKNPTYADSYLKLAEVSLLLRNTEEALNYALECNTIQSNDSEVQTLIGLCYLLRKNYPKAEEFLDSALILEPQNGRAMNIMGNLMRKLDKHDRAIDYYKHCLKCMPNFYPAMLNLGLAYFDKGDIYNGVTNIKESLKGGVDIQHSALKKGFQIFFYDDDVLHGINLYHDNQLELAAVYFEKAFKKNPSNLVVNYFIGLIKTKAQDYQSAIYCFSNVVKQITQQHENKPIRNQCMRVLLEKAKEALKGIYENVDDTVNYSDCVNEGEHKMEEDPNENVARKTQPAEIEIRTHNSQNYIMNTQEYGDRIGTTDNIIQTTGMNDHQEIKRSKETKGS